MSDISDKVNESFLHGPSKVDDVMAFANEILKGKEDKKKTPQIKKMSVILTSWSSREPKSRSRREADFFQREIS